MKKICIAFVFLSIIAVSKVRAADDCFAKLRACREYAVNVEIRVITDPNAYQKCLDLCDDAKIACKSDQNNLDSASTHHLYCKTAQQKASTPKQ